MDVRKKKHKHKKKTSFIPKHVRDNKSDLQNFLFAIFCGFNKQNILVNDKKYKMTP